MVTAGRVRGRKLFLESQTSSADLLPLSKNRRRHRCPCGDVGQAQGGLLCATFPHAPGSEAGSLLLQPRGRVARVSPSLEHPSSRPRPNPPRGTRRGSFDARCAVTPPSPDALGGPARRSGGRVWISWVRATVIIVLLLSRLRELFGQTRRDGTSARFRVGSRLSVGSTPIGPMTGTASPLSTILLLPHAYQLRPYGAGFPSRETYWVAMLRLSHRRTTGQACSVHR